MAEFTAKTIQGQEPRPGSTWLLFIAGASAVNNDTFTVTGLTTVKGAFLISSGGVVGTMTFSTNVITVTNGGALSWSGLVWGTP